MLYGTPYDDQVALFCLEPFGMFFIALVNIQCSCQNVERFRFWMTVQGNHDTGQKSSLHYAHPVIADHLGRRKKLQLRAAKLRYSYVCGCNDVLKYLVHPPVPFIHRWPAPASAIYKRAVQFSDYDLA